jgi:hypothetical protein
MLNLFGFEVHLSPDIPKMQLSEDPALMLPPAFRIEINLWMVEFFGTTNTMEDGQVISIEASRKLIMNERTYAMMKATAKELTYGPR